MTRSSCPETSSKRWRFRRDDAVERPLLTRSLHLLQGTISNVAQDVGTPHGRLWTAALVIGGILQLSSSYTFLLYRPFDYPGATVHDSNPFVACAFMPVSEKIYRAVWLVVPSVGFMTTGVIPAVTEGRGYERVLSVVHNVAAPTSMLFCMLMETIQLSRCENAFAHLFDTEPANNLYGPLTTVQRMRVVALCMAWCFGITFVGVQGYLLVRTNRSHTVALVSYSAEVFGLCLAFLMPSLGGIDWLIWTTPSDDSWLDETDDAVEIARNIVKCFVSCGTFSSCRWKAELEGEATGALVCDVGARTSIG